MVTGKGLGDIIREKYGVGISFMVFGGLFIANTGTVIANFSAIKITATLFGLSPYILIPGIILISFLFVVKGNYKTNQNLFLLSAFFYISYIISAVKAGPDWGKALTSIVIPQGIVLSKEFLFASIAVLGTTIVISLIKNYPLINFDIHR